MSRALRQDQKLHRRAARLYAAKNYSGLSAFCAQHLQEPAPRAARPLLLYYRALAQALQEDYSAALYYTTEIIDTSDVARDLKALAYNARGLAELSLGNYNNAEKDFAAAVELVPQNSCFTANQQQCLALCAQQEEVRAFARFGTALMTSTAQIAQTSTQKLIQEDPAAGHPPTPEKETRARQLFQELTATAQKSQATKARIAQLSGELINAKAELRTRHPEIFHAVRKAETEDNRNVREINYLSQLLLKTEQQVQQNSAILFATHKKTMAALDTCVVAAGVAHKNNADLVRAAQNDPVLKKELQQSSASHLRQYHANFVALNLRHHLLGQLAHAAENLVAVGHEIGEKLLPGAEPGLVRLRALYEQRTEELIFYRQTLEEGQHLTHELNQYNKALFLFYKQGQENLTQLITDRPYQNYWINIPEFHQRYVGKEIRAKIEFVANLALRQDKIIDLQEYAETVTAKLATTAGRSV